MSSRPTRSFSKLRPLAAGSGRACSCVAAGDEGACGCEAGDAAAGGGWAAAAACGAPPAASVGQRRIGDGQLGRARRRHLLELPTKVRDLVRVIQRDFLTERLFDRVDVGGGIDAEQSVMGLHNSRWRPDRATRVSLKFRS
jgi:hypothetical protein